MAGDAPLPARRKGHLAKVGLARRLRQETTFSLLADGDGICRLFHIAAGAGIRLDADKSSAPSLDIDSIVVRRGQNSCWFFHRRNLHLNEFRSDMELSQGCEWV